MSNADELKGDEKFVSVGSGPWAERDPRTYGAWMSEASRRELVNLRSEIVELRAAIERVRVLIAEYAERGDYEVANDFDNALAQSSAGNP